MGHEVVAESRHLDSDLYVNQELSLLAFNERVLAQALDANQPLLERLRFVLICTRNLDEFFEVRVARLKHQLRFNSAARASDGLSPADALTRISERCHLLVTEQYRILNSILLPALIQEQLRFIRRLDWTEAQADWIKKYFLHEVLPVITPMALDLSHPLPRLINKSLHFIVTLEGKDAFGRDLGKAVVHAPRSLPQMVRLPAHLAEDGENFVFLSSIIHAHAHELFPGMQVTGWYQFRLTRNSELFVDEEQVRDLASALKGGLDTRHFGQEVRLELASSCPADIAQFLLQQFGLTEQDLYLIDGTVSLSRLLSVPEMIAREDLKYPRFVPGLPAVLKTSPDIFAAIQREDLLLNHPFESFRPVIDFVKQAALDPNVMSIKQTLYRTGPNTEMVPALIEAARAGKEVCVIVELRARFDEQENLTLAQRLQEAGVLVVYGVVGYKTHAKMTLVVRREGEQLIRYAHLGTGNYHAGNACLYTDYSLLTADHEICDDVHKVFMQLTGMGKTLRLKKLLQAPFSLYRVLLELIQQETEHARQGRPARILARMNALTEPLVISALYKASQQGVQIDLIVRGICCLRPGVAGLSDQIRVRSIIGRFLEHSRVYYFLNDGHEKLYLSSADWMERNLHKRIEVAFPIEHKTLMQRIKRDLERYLDDNCQSWQMQPDGRYLLNEPGDHERRSAQQELLQRMALC